MIRKLVPHAAVAVMLLALGGEVVSVAQTPPAMPEDREEDQSKPAKRDPINLEDDDSKAPPPPPPPVLQLTSDMDCTVKIDGREVTTLLKNEPQKLRIARGEHLIQAFSTEVADAPPWENTVKAPDTGQVVTIIELTEIVEDWREQQRAQEEEGRFIIGEGTIHDNDSGLTWTSSTVTELKWSEAASLCQKKRIAGQGGWRLPTVQELSTLYWPDHPDPRHEAQEGETTSMLFGLKKVKGPMEVAPVMIHRPFEEIPRLSAIWVTDQKVSCSFLGELNCSGGQKRGDALCVRSGR